ncbi:unnamed protein product [Effrenium voratum]|nr:unnamed protein product [Effrenium voratum]
MASYLPENFEAESAGAAAASPLDRANVFRRRGNELYSKAKEISKDADPYTNLRGVQESVKLYQSAMVEYGKALHFLPHDHRLFANRALCYKAVEDWVKCKEDAQQCIKLRRDYVKGWLLLVKAIWELGKHSEAAQELHNGLKAVPGSKDLLELQAALSTGSQTQVRSAGRSVSPAATPGNTPSVSRSNTPPRTATPPPPMREVAPTGSPIQHSFENTLPESEATLPPIGAGRSGPWP